MTRIVRTISCPKARARNRCAKHPLASLDVDEVEAWIKAEVNTPADMHKVLTWLVVQAKPKKRRSQDSADRSAKGE